MSDSCWIANCSDGSSHVENWIDGELSPWRRLMLYCEVNNAYITNLRMTVGTQTVSCAKGAVGYWQTNAMPAIQGIECDEELHKWHGIGWVEGDKVNIIWGALDPRSHQVIFWSDQRGTEGQQQIIWGKPEWSLVNPDKEAPVPKIPADVAGAKTYQKLIHDSQT